MIGAEATPEPEQHDPPPPVSESHTCVQGQVLHVNAGE
jgi:hypothetical protein